MAENCEGKLNHKIQQFHFHQKGLYNILIHNIIIDYVQKNWANGVIK